tara:strand:- start:1150 stop:1497 length:348 start_codon:yes stop_codon:yes gene_type:complete
MKLFGNRIITQEEKEFNNAKNFRRISFGFWRNLASKVFSGVSVIKRPSEFADDLYDAGVLAEVVSSREEVEELLPTFDSKSLSYSPHFLDELRFRTVKMVDGSLGYRISSHFYCN